MMHIGQERNVGKWWLCAGCVGLVITAAFIAATLYLGAKEQMRSPTPRPRFRHVPIPQDVQEVEEVAALEPGPDPVALDELFPVKQNPVRKKSEAIYPEQPEFREDFRLPGLTPKVPPFQYVKEYEYEEAVENPMLTLLQKRLRDAYDFIGGHKLFGTDWIEVLDSVNESITANNATIVLSKLREMYHNTSSPDVSMSSLIYPTRQALMTNASSLVSFGLLAIDLFLLHNVQQIALSENSRFADRLKSDPEVIAMNALFLPKDQLRDLGRSQEEDEGVMSDVLEFFQSAIRAIVNLGRAYKKTTNPVQGRSQEPSPLDCIWTLYCRNLDKTAKLHGPYGLLAKMNSLGLRLMMGEFPIEQALEKLFAEFVGGWGQINCNKLFPRCSAEEARHVVMETALGENRI